ncbi:hypothetical protein [Zooshikella harenae]|uniref:Uncharacterized protein n=1 Tax=Zooshikella harenae TaxID=2827238 RepID=A0ABS5ZEG6_9GAMM|nr:hypothetical protein [Zooshikella harenae]MBU2711660.1 hypothetical protein [Zooshikella harenae]
MNTELPSEKIVALKLAQLSWVDRYWILSRLNKKQRTRIKSILKVIKKSQFSKLSFNETNELINQATYTLNDSTNRLSNDNGSTNVSNETFEGLPPFLYNYTINKVYNNDNADSVKKMTEHTQTALNKIIEDMLEQSEVSS